MNQAFEYLKQAAFLNNDDYYRTITVCKAGIVIRRSDGASDAKKEIVIPWLEIECSDVNPVTAALKRMK